MTETPESTDRRTPDEWDAVYDTLASHRRRLVLAFLDREVQAYLADIVETIARNEPAEGRAGAARDRQAIEISLHHVHLPKLEDAGFVEWDRETTEVTLTESPPVPLADLPPTLLGGSDICGASTTD
ncbi:DUF7344 domain-containing protein [Halomarina litorea]|uniref:DUF7344 domain-containing protein n=1 Tax=Halomarina litorea TaxID=2961595 RepID=UPI0020C42AFC|nr:hypothetical protein [Halomarina sp. BCD28]